LVDLRILTILDSISYFNSS